MDPHCIRSDCEVHFFRCSVILVSSAVSAISLFIFIKCQDPCLFRCLGVGVASCSILFDSIVRSDRIGLPTFHLKVTGIDHSNLLKLVAVIILNILECCRTVCGKNMQPISGSRISSVHQCSDPGSDQFGISVRKELPCPFFPPQRSKRIRPVRNF